MRTPIACCLAATVSILLPALAQGNPQVGEKDNGFSICDEQALHLYAEGAKADLDLGRNRVDDGKLLKDGSVVSEPHPCQWRDRLEAIVHPPAPPPEPTPASSVSEGVAASAPTTTTVAPSSASTSTVPDYIVQCESGGSYSAVNPSSGAYGKYQIIPSTAAAYGCDLSTPAGQDSCASAIYSDVGASAWSCG